MVAMTGKQAWSRFASWLNAALAEDERRHEGGIKKAREEARRLFDEDDDEDITYRPAVAVQTDEHKTLSRDDETTCRHEAGHALVAAVCGVRVHSAALTPDDRRFCGQTTHDAGSPEVEAAIIAAGPLAEVRERLGESAAGVRNATRDRITVERSATWSRDNAMLDTLAREHERQARLRGRHADTAVAFKERAQHRATSILRAHAKALAAITDHIKQHGTIDGDGVLGYVAQHAPADYKRRGAAAWMR